MIFARKRAPMLVFGRLRYEVRQFSRSAIATKIINLCGAA
jgi:hypothetical protein